MPARCERAAASRPSSPSRKRNKRCHREGGYVYLRDFQTLEEAREVIGEFIEREDRGWLLDAFDQRTSAEVRQQLMRKAA